VVAVILGLGAGVMLALGALGDRLARIALADAVADSVALAAAADGVGQSAGAEKSAEVLAQANNFEVVSIEWNSLDSSHCRVEVEVQESQALLHGKNNFLASLISNTPVSSKAAAVSNQPCS